MPEAPDTIDDAVEALSSPTTAELVDDVGVRDFSAREMAAYAIANAGGGGGGGVQSVSETVTTDPDTSVVRQEFDLERLAFAYAKATLLDMTPDGETFGNGAGEIGVGFVTVTDVGVSLDGVVWTPNGVLGGLSPLNVYNDVGVMDTVGHYELLAAYTPRYWAVGVGIVDNDTGEIYAGANNPQAEVRVDVEYL